MYHFEVYLLEKNITQDHWQKLHLSVSQYIGLLKAYEFQMRIEENVVRFFISSEKDISVVSNNLEGMVLRPVPAEDLELPNAQQKERFLRLVTGGNLLDFREKYQVKRGKSVDVVYCKVRQVNPEKSWVSTQVYLKGAANIWSVTSKRFLNFPTNLFAVNFETNTKYLKKSIPKYLNIEKSLSVLTSVKENAVFAVDTFPYFSTPYYLGLGNYEFDKHSLIVGTSGSGKSKLIEILVDRMSKAGLRDQYRVIVIDPHASLAPDLGHITNSLNVNFSSSSSDLFPTTKDATAATELSTALFKSLLGDQFNPKVERVIRFSLFVLFTAKKMDFPTLKSFLTDLELRTKILNTTQGLPPNIHQFFTTDFNELKTQYYTEALMPIISLIDEIALLPSISQPSSVSLKKTIQDNFLTVFSLNKVSMGEKVVKTVAGLLIQNIFILAQARSFNQKVILIVDEVSVVQNPTLASILAEARKFNLSLILTQQYFSQISKRLQDAIFSNVYNYYAFKVSEEDARLLEGNLNIEIPDELLKEAKDKGINETAFKIKVMTELHSRKALVRVYADGQYHPAVKARTMDAPSTLKGTEQNMVEQEPGPAPKVEQPDFSQPGPIESTLPLPLPAAPQTERSPEFLAQAPPLTSPKLEQIDPSQLQTANINPDDITTFQLPQLGSDWIPAPEVGGHLGGNQATPSENMEPPSASTLLLEYSSNSRFDKKELKKS